MSRETNEPYGGGSNTQLPHGPMLQRRHGCDTMIGCWLIIAGRDRHDKRWDRWDLQIGASLFSDARTDHSRANSIAATQYTSKPT
jgi:hypothetical protein